MIKLSQTIVVEGRYDKNKVKQIFDAPVLDLGGFQIFKDREMLELIRRIAKDSGIIVLTDADGAGLVIRNFIKSTVQCGNVFHAYIPEIVGKEARKASPSKEGMLGVEGVDDSIIIEAVRKSGAVCANNPDAAKERITKVDLFKMGLSGQKNSAEARKKLCGRLELPKNLSANAFLEVVNIVLSKEELTEIAGEVST